MTNKGLSELSPDARVVVKALMELIPNWKYVDLTKKGYNQQYAETVVDVMFYIMGREQSIRKEIREL